MADKIEIIKIEKETSKYDNPKVKILGIENESMKGELVYSQKGNQCVASSAINGLLSSRNNEITLKEAGGLVKAIIEHYRTDNNSLGAMPANYLTYLKKDFKELFSQYTINVVTEISDKDFEIMKQSLKKRESFFSMPDYDTKNHQVCVFDCKNNEFYVKDSLGGRIKKIGEIGLREHLDNKMNKYYPGVIFSIDNTLL